MTDNIQYLVRKYWNLDKETFEIVSFKYDSFGKNKKLLVTRHEGIYTISELINLKQAIEDFLN